MGDFSIGDAFSFGWDAMKKNFLLFAYIIVTFIVIALLHELSRYLGPINIIVMIACIIAYMILKLGTISISLNIVGKKPVSYQQLFSQITLFVDFLIGTVLYVLIVIGGLILLIVPGIIWALKFQFYAYYIVDKKLSPFEALKRSAKATYGYKWQLFLFALALIGINIVGAIALLIGLFATIPTSLIAMAWTYRTIDANYSATQAAIKKK